MGGISIGGIASILISIAIGAVPLFVIYPFMKRITNWPQAFLGLTFNIGVLIAYATIRNDISFSAIALYFAGIMWTLGYDTIYALQDREDDLKIGVKSTAIRFGEKTKFFVGVFAMQPLSAHSGNDFASHLALSATFSIDVAQFVAGFVWPVANFFQANAWR